MDGISGKGSTPLDMKTAAQSTLYDRNLTHFTN